MKLLKDQPPCKSEGLLNALRYTTKHLNEENTPKNIKNLLAAWLPKQRGCCIRSWDYRPHFLADISQMVSFRTTVFVNSVLKVQSASDFFLACVWQIADHTRVLDKALCRKLPENCRDSWSLRTTIIKWHDNVTIDFGRTIIARFFYFPAISSEEYIYVRLLLF